MRRFIAILLMLLLAANISGAKLTHHICGKVFQYASWNGHKKDTKCCCKGSGVDKGCCKTTYFKVKIDDGKKLAVAYSPQFVLGDAIIPVTPVPTYNSPRTEWPAVSKAYIPQKVRWWRDDIYIFHCVYRI